ncbi:hypothetical protein GTR02_21650, partial [Kineococcus sp. R8]
ATSPAFAAPSPALSPAPAQPTTCQELAAARFVVADAARADGPGVRVSGRSATASCAGPAGVAFDVSRDVVTVRLVAGATVVVLAPDDAGPAVRSLPPAALPAWLSSGGTARTFQVTGPASAATALTEQRRP